jgi:uncharacterized protein YndB with AHSA1/START domain
MKTAKKTGKKISITVKTSVKLPVDRVWKLWTEPEHITKWNQASADWHTPWAENDLRPGGKWSSRMEAKDGSAGFDFWGMYDEVRRHEKIVSTLGDGRRMSVEFARRGPQTVVTETFETEDENTVERQRQGWQAILDSFKRYAEETSWPA